MKNRFLKIVALSIAAVMTLMCLCACPGKKETKSEALNALEKIFDKAFASSEADAPSYKTTSSEMVIKDLGTLLGMPSLGEITLKEYSDVESLNSVISAAVKYGEDSLTLDSFVSDNSVILTSNAVNGAYGVSYDALMESLDDMMNAIFVPNTVRPSKSVGLSDYDDNDIVMEGATSAGMASSIVSLLAANIDMEKAEKLIVKYSEVFADAAEKAIEQKCDITANEVKVELEFNADSAKKLIKDVFTAAKKDKELKAFVNDLLKGFASGDELNEIMDAYDEIFSDSTLDMLFEGMDDISFSLSLKVVADKSYNLKSLEFIMAEPDMDMTASMKLEFTANGGFAFTFDNALDGESIDKYVFKYDVKQDDKKAFDATLSAKEYSFGEADDAVSFNIKHNKETKDFTVSTTVEGETVSVNGKADFAEKKQTIQITDISAMGETVQFNVTFTVEYDVTLPKAPASYTSIYEMTEEDMATLTTELMNNPVISELMNLMPKEDTDDNDDYFDDDYFDDDYFDDDFVIDTLPDDDFSSDDFDDIFGDDFSEEDFDDIFGDDFSEEDFEDLFGDI